MPDLYLSQTAHFVEAYHHHAGNWEVSGKSQGRFARKDVRMRDLGEGWGEWEWGNGEVLGRYADVVRGILGIVGKGKEGEGEGEGVWEVSYVRDGDGGLVVREIVDGEMVGIGEGVRRFF